jgi:hypothetical protein
MVKNADKNSFFILLVFKCVFKKNVSRGYLILELRDKQNLQLPL